ncbi:conserved Plasmodium protein, unknown function [Babesia microti strain RI]|uniref:TFIIE beta domain-containing protein n=1 Tax=Babesia microti (strain RI) TaxID=1133968 RepID=A0A1N6LWN0_BABMR|nr:conserved Plasmodium protein, unknown function [Babesia microti strain RI]SIO73278.1 conserved Plasmodium protein, unknown function [Babesia microti strain RI]|eukprot:XP_021337382.1 conserved Plasmodium protein, unknown function [Babesia microti strain RI]
MDKVPSVLYRGEACPLSFVLHKIISLLQEEKKPMHLLQIENYLRTNGFNGIDVCNNSSILEGLRNVNRVYFDTERKQLSYVNPYESIASAEALLAKINHSCQVSGIRVTNEMIFANDSMPKWINELLEKRKLRCIRPNSSNLKGKFKCRFIGTSKQCDIYSKNKCHECFHNLQDLLLFPLGKKEFEEARFQLDQDIKNVWDSAVLPPLDELIRNHNLETPTINIANKREKKKGGDNIPGLRNKMRRIYNTHLFTVQELRNDYKKSQLEKRSN